VPDSDRRYTDQEVALVLHRAAELEERRTAGPGRGLTLRELHDIAREVGLGPDVIDEAVSTLQSARVPGAGSLLGPPVSNKVTRGLGGRLSEESLRRLVRLVEERVDAAGTLTEALGTVRWTSFSRGHRLDRTTQVSLSASGGETQIQVVERYPSGFRALLHFLPGAWGGMAGVIVAGATKSGLPLGAAAVLAGVALGVSIGRAVWRGLARRSERRVDEVATELVEEARKLVDR
jgi:hypothetical protein